MAKYFENTNEFNRYISELNKARWTGDLMTDLLLGQLSEEEIIENLLKDGYTDLDNLVLDGHPYCIGGHKNYIKEK